MPKRGELAHRRVHHPTRGRPFQPVHRRTEQFAQLVLARQPQRLVLVDVIQRPLGGAVEPDDRALRQPVHLDRHVAEDEHVVEVPVGNDEPVTGRGRPREAGGA